MISSMDFGEDFGKDDILACVGNLRLVRIEL
jgi:hypothetical protein